MTHDAQLFIRTHKPDLEWLKYCLRSAMKYWKSAYHPVIVATPDCEGLLPDEVKEMNASVHFEPRWNDQRAGANYAGLIADRYTEAPLILITDSDCLFRMPVTAEDFMQDGKAILRGNIWEDVKYPERSNQICIDMYRIFIRDSIHVWAKYETMRQHPFLFWREDFAGLRNLVQGTTNRDIKTWLERWSKRHEGGFVSEFNLLGTYCLHRDRPYVVLPPAPHDTMKIIQFHSWTQTPEMMSEKIAEILG